MYPQQLLARRGKIPTKIKLTRIANSLMISPWVPELKNELTLKRRERQTEWPFKYQEKKIPLFQVNKGVGLTFGGLYGRVKNYLRSAGMAYEEHNHQTTPPKPDFSKLSGALRPGQDVVLAAIAASQRGVIDCPTAFGKSFVITQIARIYPNQKILVVTPSKSVIQSLFRRLTEGTDRKVQQVRAGKVFRETSEVVVCSAKSLHHIPSDWPDMLLFDECHGAPANLTQQQLVRFTCRMFGFSASPEGRGDNADMLVEAFFGPVIAHMPYKEAVRTGSVVPIQVYLKRITHNEIVVSSEIERDRYGYWQNHVRNGEIAKIARQIPPHMQSLILVRSTEHALLLHQLLPDFALVHAGKDAQGWQDYIDKGVIPETYDYATYGNPDTDALSEQFEAGTLKRAISTTIWKEGVDPVHLRVLIRADGASGNIPGTQIPGRLARTTDGKTAGILIDFLDAFGDRFYRRSRERVGHYKRKEWEVHENWDGVFTAAMGSV